MRLLDFLPCLEAMAVVAILPLALVLIVSYFAWTKRRRLAKWRGLGLTPQIGSWEALRSWDTLAGEYRRRNLIMSWRSDESAAGVTTVRVALRSPSPSRLTMRPKWPPSGLSAWLGVPVAPQTHGVEDQFLIQSDPPDLAARVLAVSRVPAILLSDPKPVIELKGNELSFERPGYFPDPEDAVGLFDTLSELADLIEHAPSSSGAG